MRCVHVLAIVSIVLMPAFLLADEVGQPGKVHYGERLDPADYGEGIIETMAEAMARVEPAEGAPFNPKARNGQQGTWVVPSSGATYYPHSGSHNVVNKWGDTRMGIGFGMEVDVHGAYFAGQGGEGVWTAGVRAIGYRHGQEVARTEWFREIGSVPAWFEMELRGVDRIVIESEPRINGGGWYALDDLTFTRKAGAGQPQPATIVLDFEDTVHGQKLTGSGYGGLIWETGTGDFNVDQRIIPAPREVPGPGGGQVPPQPGVATSRGLGTTPEHVQDFQGVIRGDASQWSAPPDTCGAIGPNYFVETVNTVFAVYDKETGANVLMAPLSTLFNGGVGDPRVVFDQHSGRWIAIDSGFSYTSRIYLAVSLTDDPTGAWYKTNFLAAQGDDVGCWPDYPTLGVNDEGIFITSLMVGCFRTVFAIDKAPLIAPSPSLGTITAFRGLTGWTMQPVHTYGNPGGEYIPSVWSSSSLWIRRVDGPMTSPTLTDVGEVDVPAFDSPPDVPSLGSDVPLDSVDHRLMNAVYRDGSIWTTHAVAGGPGTVSRWYEIDVASLSLNQYGTVSDPVINYWMPSIMVNVRGDAIMGFSGAHSGMLAACYFTGRRADDPLGEMAEPVLLRTGLDPHEIIDSYGRNRWGDYSLCSLDPEDELTMWTIQEYSEEQSGSTSRWGTHIVELRYLFDCNGNGIDDYLDIAGGSSPDVNSDGIPDECQVPRWYVDSTATGTNLGTDWDNAYTDLAEALNAAPGSDVEEIWVAAATYTPDQGTGDRARSFVLPDGVAVYGGFAGGELSLGQRDPAVNVTILSGDLEGDDDTVGTSENSYHVVWAEGAGPDTVLDGFVIRGGNADASSPHTLGGGVYLDGGAPTLVNCVIEQNTANLGGGMYDNQGDPTLLGCSFIDNSAATSGGGGLYVISGSPVMTGCTFLGNTTNGSGGGVYLIGGSTNATMVNCLFSGNQAGDDGGGLSNFYVGPTSMVNCTFSANTAGADGGGVYTNGSNAITVANCILWGNSDAGGADESAQAHDDGSGVVVNYSCIQGLSGGLGGTGNVGTDPLFVDPDGDDNEYGTADDDLHVQGGSPCVDAADNSAVPVDVTTDLDGSPRFVDDPETSDTGSGDPPIVDMGAYEFQVAPAATIVGAASVLDHGGTELGLDLFANNIEPRQSGVLKIEFTLSGTVTTVSAGVDCNSAYGGTVTATPVGATVTVEFSEALPDQDCCEISLAGDAIDSFSVRTLAGDIDRNGTVTTGDASIIKPHFGEAAGDAGAEFDFDVSGMVTTGDFSVVKPLFGNTAPACP